MRGRIWEEKGCEYRTLPARLKGSAVLSLRGVETHGVTPRRGETVHCPSRAAIGAKLRLCCLVAWLRELRRTLEIIARTLREVVNRVRLCSHYTRGYSHGEVHVYGEVMR